MIWTIEKLNFFTLVKENKKFIKHKPTIDMLPKEI